MNESTVYNRRQSALGLVYLRSLGGSSYVSVFNKELLYCTVLIICDYADASIKMSDVAKTNSSHILVILLKTVHTLVKKYILTSMAAQVTRITMYQQQMSRSKMI